MTWYFDPETARYFVCDEHGREQTSFRHKSAALLYIAMKGGA